MLKWLFATLMITSAFAQDCDSLYEARYKSEAAAREAYSCFETLLPTQSQKVDQIHSLSRMSYLKFTIAEFFQELKLDSLYEAFTLAEKGLLLFGAKYDLDAYAKLSEQELDELAFTLYSYGLSLSRYVDLKGKLEAIKRMEDIKKSMNSILRIKREEIAYYGALRTLGIFHMKVPSIAGGQIQLSRPYLEKAIQGSLYRDGLSLYPGNSLAYAEVLFKQNQATDACKTLKVLNTITKDEVMAMNNGFVLESLADLKKAKELAVQKKCP